jgi:23S rRNA (pseudouridine1915-N3)-methyltransferase
LKIDLLYIGKPRSAEANKLADEYSGRVAHYCRFRMIRLGSETSAPEYPRALKVVFDPAGRQMSSRQFASLIEKAGRDIAFFVGGAEGFSDSFRSKADHLVSLGRMTLPHELARVVAVEQIYRAFAILNGHPYAK